MGGVADGAVGRQAASKQTAFKQKAFKRKTFRPAVFAFLKLCLTNCQDLLPGALNRVRKTPIGFTTWTYRKTNKTNMYKKG